MESSPAPRDRLLCTWGGVSIEAAIAVVAAAHDVDTTDYVVFRKQAAGREMAALLCRRYTRSTLAELSECFSLCRKTSAATR